MLGVNSRVELESAHRLLNQSHNRELMQNGISMYNHETVTVSPFAEIGRDTLLMENVHILGKSRVGLSCTIEPGAVLQDCILGDNVKVGAGSVLKNCRFDNGAEISPLTAKS